MKKSLVIFLSVLLLTGCVDSLDDYNVDTKKAPVVTPVTLFSNSLKGLIDALTTPNVSNNNFRLYVQYWAETTYLAEQRYNLTDRPIPQNLWQSVYRDAISDLTEAKRLVNADPLLTTESKNNQLAQIEIIEILSWSVLVNTFGNIPYTEAMDPFKSQPVYDDAKTVYYSLLDRLDAALLLINPTGTTFKTGDLLYGGDVEKWKRFGNSLKLRLALVIADSDPARAKTMIAAAAPNVFISNDDKARFPYIDTPPNYNPVAQNLNKKYSLRQDYVATSVLVDPMNELNDPRRSSFFTTVGGIYKGGNYGFQNTYANFSTAGTKIIDPKLEGLFMDYSEVEFGLAEAIERNFITGDAAEHYNKGITASITYWGGSANDVSTYLAQPKVAYATAAGDYKQKIGFQKWLALYNRGWDAWVEWKRLDYPKLLPPTGGTAPAGLQIPLRLIYPISEGTLNGNNTVAAGKAIGGDLASTKLWWDKF